MELPRVHCSAMMTHLLNVPPVRLGSSPDTTSLDPQTAREKLTRRPTALKQTIEDCCQFDEHRFVHTHIDRGAKTARAGQDEDLAGPFGLRGRGIGRIEIILEDTVPMEEAIECPSADPE